MKFEKEPRSMQAGRGPESGALNLRSGLVLLALLVGAYYFSQHLNSPSADATPRSPVRSVPEAESSGDRSSIFTNVDLLEKATSPVLGVVTYRNLGDEMGYYGSTEAVVQGPGFLPSSVHYSLSGKSARTVKKVLLKGFVSSPGGLTDIRKILESAAIQWFKSVGKILPSRLVAAIQAGSPFQEDEYGLSVRYVVEIGDGSPIRQPDGSSYRAVFMYLTITPI